MLLGATLRPTRRRVVAGMASLAAVGTGGGLAVDYTRGGDRSRPAVVGHRGAAGLAPPNTLAAIRRALAVGVDGVELDVRRTADGALVLFHDPILDWATTASGRIHETRWADLAGARIHGEPIPRLEAALSLLAEADVEVFLEAKRGGYTDEILDVAERHRLLDRVTLSSFESDALAPARERGVRTALVGVAPRPELVDSARAADADVVSSHYVPAAFGEFVRRADRAGLAAGVWHLVETAESLEAAEGTAPDFITTNRPDLAVRALDG